MTELKLQTLIDRGACADQVALFRAKFGESVDVTSELCESVASVFDFEWAARNLLPPAAYAERERVMAPAYAEYKRVRDAAYAEYMRVIAREFARQYIAQGGCQMTDTQDIDKKYGLTGSCIGCRRVTWLCRRDRKCGKYNRKPKAGYIARPTGYAKPGSIGERGEVEG